MSRRARRLGLAALGAGAAFGLLIGAGPDAARDAAPDTDAADAAPAPRRAVAIFAGGCFWCMEPPFDALPGVLSTTPGYTGGELPDPSYEQVSAGGTGHLEAVRVEYDPERIGYTRLLEVFWRNVDPTDAGGQFCDRGPQYATAIFASDEEQRTLAEASQRALAASCRLTAPVVTPIRTAGPFYPAEDYHQDYYEKKPLRYRLYRTACGRDRALERLWGPATAAAP